MMSNASKPKIRVSLTVISSRIDRVTSTIDSLLAQDYGRFILTVYVSREPFLLDGGLRGPLPEPLAQACRRDDRLRIKIVPNLGPFRKILPALSEVRGTRCLIATADDDTIYPSNWLSSLFEHYYRHRCVVCFRGHRIVRDGPHLAAYREWMRNGIIRNPDLANLPTGKDGVLYDSAFFHKGVLNSGLALKLAPTADDLWLKWHYSALGDVPTFVINEDYTTDTFSSYTSTKTLYNSFNREGGNDQSAEKLENYARERGGTPLALKI